MRRPPKMCPVILVATVLLASCTSSEPAPEPAATSTQVETTTTTVAEPTAPEPQRLRYSYEDDLLMEYDFEMGLSIETIESDLDEEIAVSVELEGTLEQLVLPTLEPGTFELVLSLSGDSSITAKADGTTMTQELGAFGGNFFGMGSPLLVNEEGHPVMGRTGAPAYSEAPTRLLTVLDSVGPTFGSAPVGAGDNWTHVMEDGLIGPIAVNGAILAAEGENSSTFLFEVSIEPRSLPAVVDWGEAVEGGWVAADVVNAFGLELHETINADLAFEKVEFEASGVFDSAAGLLIEYEARSQLDYRMAFASEGESQEVAYRVETTSRRELTGTGTASTADLDRILTTYAADPFETAVQALPTPPGYTRSDFAVARLSVLFEKLADTRSDLVVAGDFARFTDPNGDSVDVAAITNGGSERGDPMIMWGLAAFWSGEEPRIVDVDGRPAAQATIAEDTWTIWASDTHTYVAIGPSDVAASVIASIADMVDSYLWQSGDCLDFSDQEGVGPHSPFGRYGLVHCSADHQYEVLHSAVLPDPRDASFPDGLGFRALDTCVTSFYEASGVTPILSTLDAISYYPDLAEWERGARYMACVIYVGGQQQRPDVRSRFDLSDQRYVRALEPGMCLQRSVAVPCSEQHSHEIVSVETYGASPSDQPPEDRRALIDELSERCQAPLEAYDTVEGPASILAGPLTDLPYAWSAGNRAFYCSAYAVDSNGDIVDIVGSLTGDWDLATDGSNA